MASKSGSIVKKSIQIDVSSGAKSVKALKEEIKDLRDALLNLEEGTEEYDETQKRLTEDVDDLNRVMNAHKTDAKELEGSYNSLQNKLKELRQAWKATNDEAERDVLGKKILEINNQLKTMDASIGDFKRNVGNYESAWQGLSKVMEQDEKIADDLNKGITAFGKAMGMSESQVKGLSDALRKLKDAFKIAKDITKMREETTKLSTAEKEAAIQGNTLAASQTATGTAAKGMATAENTATVATKGLSIAMKGLKAALISTGIGAAVVAFGEFANVLNKLGIFGDGAREEIDALSDEAVESSEKAVGAAHGLAAVISSLAGAVGLNTLIRDAFSAARQTAYAGNLAKMVEGGAKISKFKTFFKQFKLTLNPNAGIAGAAAVTSIVGNEYVKDELAQVSVIQKAQQELVKLQNERVSGLETERESVAKELDFELRLAKARGASEEELLEMEKERTIQLREEALKRQQIAEEDRKATEDDLKAFQERLDDMRKVSTVEVIGSFPNLAPAYAKMGQNALKASANALQQSLDAQNSALTISNNLIKEYDERLQQIDQDLYILQETKGKITGTGEELKKWADVVKDPKFQEEWRKIFEVDYSDLTPVDRLKEQYISAIELLNKWKTETQEVDTFFQQAISDAHNVWGTIVGKESEMFEESKTPLMKLQEEFDDWLELYKEWGADTLALTQYYEKKIAEERERIATEELDAFVTKMDERLEMEDRLANLFKPVSGNKTVEEDINNLTALYNTQMEYLNGLLEAADLTEEAYSAVEERILSLTITFGKEMEKLRDEQDETNKKFGWMTQKWVANWQFMEDAAASFSDAFTDLGLENSIAFKAFATAQALISTYLAANRVMAETAGGLWARIAAAAAITTAGLANVYSIWSVNADGSNSSSFSSSVSMNATPAIIDSTPIQTVTTPQYTNTEDEINRPIFVTVTDIQEGLDHKVTVTDETSF